MSLSHKGLKKTTYLHKIKKNVWHVAHQKICIVIRAYFKIEGKHPTYPKRASYPDVFLPDQWKHQVLDFENT